MLFKTYKWRFAIVGSHMVGALNGHFAQKREEKLCELLKLYESNINTL